MRPTRPPGEKERDLPLLPRGDNARGEQSRALAGVRRLFFHSRNARTRPRQRQNLHAGVIVIKDLALRGLTDQFVENRPDHLRHFLDDLPLRRGGQRNPQVLFQARQPVERNPAAVFQQRDHGGRALVVFLIAHARRRFRLEDLAAQVTAQTLQLIDRGLKRRLPHHSDA